MKSKYCVKVLINYLQSKYSSGFYLMQTIQEVKFPNFSLRNNPNKKPNRSEAEFDMEVFK